MTYPSPNNIKICPSILAADFARLGKEAHNVLDAGADWIHFDVMDNHYVPNLTVGPMVCKALREYGIKAPIDVHLMVEPVDELIKKFAEAGATLISFHPEASKHVERSLQLIKDSGCQAGLAFNPATPINILEHTLHKLDLVLLMSVNPGFGGQKFIEHTHKKIMATRTLIDQFLTVTSSSPQSTNIRLQVDGGITANNIKNIARSGADTFVIGTALFSTQDYASTINGMREQIKEL